MAKRVSKKELDKLAPIIANELRGAKSNPKQIANKYGIEVSLVQSIAKKRKTGIVIDNNDVLNIPIEQEMEEIMKTEEAKEVKKHLTKEQRDDVYELFAGGISINDICDEYNISNSTVRRIIDKKKSASSEEKQEEIKPISAEKMEFLGSKLPFESVQKCKKDSSIIEVGMIDGRHDLPASVNTFFFDSIEDENIDNFKWQEKEIEEKFIELLGNDRDKAVAIYITGLQPVLISIINVAMRMGINVVAKHYNPNAGGYYQQQIGSAAPINTAYPFSRLEINSDIYFVDGLTLEACINKTLYAITIQQYDNYKDISDSKVFISDSEDVMWKYYPQIIKMINKKSENLKVLLASMTTTEGSFCWGANISKGFNFRDN